MRIHVLGVCGTFMGGIARLAAACGNEVSGSDLCFYEPMASQLHDAGIATVEGYDNLPEADLFIVGNVISRGNPAFEQLLASRARFVSGPQWLAENILGGCPQVLAVAGTHGKTTTTALCIHILERCNRNPGYLIGGAPSAGAPSARLGSGDLFVIEADEYDTALFDKRPKFVHYWADAHVLGNIEFDHADIYRDLADIERQFALLPRHLRAGGTLIANWADEQVRAAAPECDWHKTVLINDSAGYHWQGGELFFGNERLGSAPALPPGAHNRANALAAIAACAVLGVRHTDALAALEDFELPARRLQEIHNNGGVIVIDDFAHHPTAIAATLAALGELHPGRRLLAALEPRSNTMRSGHWAGQLASSLAAAQRIYILAEGCDWDVAAALAPLGERARICASAQQLQEMVLGEIRDGDLLALLSNGDFGGLRASLPQALEQSRISGESLE